MWKVFLQGRVTEDLDAHYPLRTDVEPPSAKSTFRPRKKKRLSLEKWKAAFDSQGRLKDWDGVLESLRRGGCDPAIRAEVWEFLLGLYSVRSTAEERKQIRRARKAMYANLKAECNLVDPVIGSGLVVDFPRVREDGTEVPVPKGVGGGSKGAKANVAMLQQLDLTSQVGTEGGNGVGREEVESEARPEDEEASVALIPVASVGESVRLEGERELQLSEPVPETRAEVVQRTGPERVRRWRLGLHQIGVDVMRADRNLQFYEDEGNRARLMDVLAMYSWFDHEVGYCQGMGDLMSPMVVLFSDNADAFWCFERLMRNCRADFIAGENGIGVQKEISHIVTLLKMFDPALFFHLEEQNAGQLLFTVRPLMAQFRRELSFSDSLYLWEMQWASEYRLDEVEKMIEDENRAIRMVARDPHKGSDRMSFFESETEYVSRRNMVARLAAKPPGMEGISERDGVDKEEGEGGSAGGTSCEPSVSRAVSADVAASGAAAGAHVMARGHSFGRRMGVGQPRKAKEKWATAYLELVKRGQEGEAATLQAVQDSAASGLLSRRKTRMRGLNGTKGKPLNGVTPLSIGASATAGQHPQSTTPHSALTTPGRMPLSSTPHSLGPTTPHSLPAPDLESVGGASRREGEDGDWDVGAADARLPPRRLRINTLCVATVLIKGQKRFLACESMEDIVDEFNDACGKWDVKKLTKAARKLRNLYDHMLALAMSL